MNQIRKCSAQKSALGRLIVMFFAFLVIPPAVCVAAEQPTRPRLIVLTDIGNEPDDAESLVRLLVYANEFDIEGLIATTSVWLKDKVNPQMILERIDAYGKVRDNLLKHAPGYPTVEALKAVVAAGRPEFGMAGVGAGKSSDGSRLIIKAVDKADPRPVWIAVWGGPNCLAQALWDVKNSRGTEELDKFVARLRVYAISDQDDSGRWLRLTFPKLFYIVSPSSVDAAEYHKATWTGISGDRHYKNGPMYKFELVDTPWLKANIIDNHGPLGALYPAPAYIMEGDTPSFLGLIDNGLGSRLSPAYGGWGGRYALHQTYAEVRPIWTNTRRSRDTVTLDNGTSVTSDQATIWRWRQAYQNDFAARMDWCVAETFEEANHNPVAVVNGIDGKDVIEMKAAPGTEIRLSAEGSSDPDGDTITYLWWQYAEAGTARKRLALEGPDRPVTRFTLPDEEPGRTFHVILQLQDNGKPNLFAYRRIIVTVEAPPKPKTDAAPNAAP